MALEDRNWGWTLQVLHPHSTVATQPTPLERSVLPPPRPIQALQAVQDMDLPWNLRYQRIPEAWGSSVRGRQIDDCQFRRGLAHFKIRMATTIRLLIQVHLPLQLRIMPIQVVSMPVPLLLPSRVHARSQVQFRAMIGAEEHGTLPPTQQQGSITPVLQPAA